MYSLIQFLPVNEPYNDKLLKIKENDNIKQYVDVLCKNLEHVNVKYLGSEINEYYFDDTTVIDVNISRLDNIDMKFHIDGYDIHNKFVEKDITLNLKFFKLIENHFLYNGVRYTPILQLVENFYVRVNKKKSDHDVSEKFITLKTLLIGLTLEVKANSIHSITNEQISGYEYTIYVFKKRINFLYYFLGEYGWSECLKLLGLDPGKVSVMLTKDVPITMKNAFEINKKYSLTYNDELTDQYVNDLIINLVHILKTKVKKHNLVSVILDKEFWLASLGEFISKSNAAKKGEKLLISFKKIVDDWTKIVLQSSLKMENYLDITTYEVIKYMVKNYYSLRKRNNLDLRYKRLRFYEYMVVPLAKKLSTISHRIIRKTDNSIKDKENIAKINPNFLIKSNIVGNELIRYDGGTSMIAIFDLLRVSYKGPQSISKSSSNKYRGLHPSYIGRVSLVYASAGDPGVTSTLTPFARLRDNNFFDFRDK